MKTKKIISVIISFLILWMGFQTLTVSAEDNPYNYSGEPSRAIYYVLPTMKGNDVKWIQCALNLFGNYGLAIDGSFGPACKEATKQFQAAMGLDQDGSFGPATRSTMVNWLNSRNQSSNPAPKPAPSKTTITDNPYNYSNEPSRAIYYTLPTMKGNDVKWIQAALNAYGNYGLSIDGSFGPSCKEATQKFQASIGLFQDGSFGPATRNKMVEWLKNQGCTSSNKNSTNTSDSNANSGSINNFINDNRWKAGTPWGYGKKPEISSWSSIGCCAYCADFIKYVYGKTSLYDGTQVSLNNLNAGNVVYARYNGGEGQHWFVVIERNGNSLKVAERWADYVVIGWNYSINDGILYRGNMKFDFKNGYSY